MSLEIEGKVVKLLPEQTGEGKNGRWVRQDFVIETKEQYPKKICFSSWGDKSDAVKRLKPGEDVKVSFNVESREFNDKWYTDLRIWKLEKIVTKAVTGNGNSTETVNPVIDDTPPFAEESNDLPF